MQAITFTLLFILMVVIDAVGDAWIRLETGFKSKFSWFTQDLLILSTFIMAFFAIHYELSVTHLTQLFFGYILMRMALFGAIWGCIHPFVRWDYIGRTKWYDKALYWAIHNSWFGVKFKPPQKMFLGIFYTACFLFSLVLTGIWKLFE